jgi:beta-glucosidase-like glycosyl hydrolase/CubicO group peptidase (beta-lactamase class C family)
MMKRLFAGLLPVLTSTFLCAQTPAHLWSDSVYNSLTNDQRIAQLMVVRLSTIDGKTKTVTFFDDQVMKLVKDYNIGGICLFQGSPVKQATILNKLQANAKTPIMMCIDGEWGLGMRMTDSVLPLPKQMMLGAMKDATIVYNYGKIVAEQCRRIGIQVNYAPVVDINNNPNNPVINDRSFGEDKYKVADFGVAYMKGMQDNGVMATAKHFPGHGDVSVDSHYDLPVINKTMAQLDSLELYPFIKMFKAGVGSVMVAHLSIPAIDSTANRATSLSPQNINGLLRHTLGYEGLTFTDALEMQGVQKYYPGGSASVQSLIAGNDMLCLPGDVPGAITKIKEAIANKEMSWKDIEYHCKKVLAAKYQYGLGSLKPINTENLTADLNARIPVMRKLVAENAITLLAKKDEVFFPLAPTQNAGDVAYVAVGIKESNEFARRMQRDYQADVFYASNGTPDLQTRLKAYKRIVIGLHNLSRSPATNFGLTAADVKLVTDLQQSNTAITFLFGNAYAAKNWCSAANLVVCYEDDSIVQTAAVDMLQGKLPFKGVLPVSVCDNFKFGDGIVGSVVLPETINRYGINESKLHKIDSIANDAIARGATPGCVVLVARQGHIVYEKAFGTDAYNDRTPVTEESVYDMASVTKICATTLSVMRLYDQGKLDLKKKLGDYLPWVKGSNKEHLSIEKILLHQAGLVAFIPFYKETMLPSGGLVPGVYSKIYSDSFSIPVANNFYMRTSWRDTIIKKILESPLGPQDKYVYSDNDFIFLGKIVESISGMPLEEYVRKEFYLPMSLTSAGFKPLQRIRPSGIMPTENDTAFRHQLLRGYVHDQGAAMFGGVAGHAGLFSNAYDMASVMQMLLNGGTFNGRRYLQKETIDLFTAYHSNISRRGYGFDKPEKDNASRKEPYPTLSASPATFGHTGFTGTCVWADPAKELVYVFLSNRVNPEVQNTLLNLNVRPKIHEVIYEALEAR